MSTTSNVLKYLVYVSFICICQVNSSTWPISLSQSFRSFHTFLNVVQEGWHVNRELRQLTPAAMICNLNCACFNEVAFAMNAIELFKCLGAGSCQKWTVDTATLIKWENEYSTAQWMGSFRGHDPGFGDSARFVRPIKLKSKSSADLTGCFLCWLCVITVWEIIGLPLQQALPYLKEVKTLILDSAYVCTVH